MVIILVLPSFMEDAIEFGFRRAASNLISQQLSLRFIHAIFGDRTRAFYFSRTLRIGSALYIDTARSFAGMTPSFTMLYKHFSRSHLMFAGELASMLCAYALYTRAEVYGLHTLPIWIIVTSCSFSPWLFNP